MIRLHRIIAWSGRHLVNECSRGFADPNWGNS
jgi:hypothetical protein